MNFIKTNALNIVFLIVLLTGSYVLYQQIVKVDQTSKKASESNAANLAKVETLSADNNKRLEGLERDAKNIQVDVDEIKAIVKKSPATPPAR